MTTLEKQLYRFGIVPVVKIERIEDAKPLAIALAQGGLCVAEVTFRSDCAKEAMIQMKQAVPTMLLGAGTVLTTTQVDEAIAAGAEFIVSPGLNEQVVRYCQEKEIVILPGCATPSDMEKAIALGLKTVKFFPAEANGGIAAIKAMSAPYAALRFMPTGGVSETNLHEYLSFPKILACGGTWMVKDDLIKQGRFDEITRLTKLAVQKMIDMRLAHVGLHTDAAHKQEIIHALSSFTQCEAIPSGNNVFVKDVEIMEQASHGAHGHIAYAVNNVERARFHMEAQGICFDEASAQYDADGICTLIYAKQCVQGFGLHLMKR